MRLKIYGFSFDKTKAPVAIDANDIFVSLASNSTLTTQEHLRHAIGTVDVLNPITSKAEKWWMGIVLKVRDSKLLTMLTERDGASVLTSEMLAGADKLAEPSFMLANPRTGAGLYAHHYQSAPLVSGLLSIMIDRFKKIQERHLSEVAEDEQMSIEDRKEKTKTLAGFLWPQQLVLPQQFKQLVAAMKSVESVKVRLASVTSGRRLFRGCTFVPEKETVEYKLPIDALSDEIADSLQLALDQNVASKITVHGKDRHGHERSFSQDRNPHVFDEQDYDPIMEGFELSMTDFEASLQQSKVIQHLVALARGKVVWELLERS